MNSLSSESDFSIFNTFQAQVMSLARLMSGNVLLCEHQPSNQTHLGEVVVLHTQWAQGARANVLPYAFPDHSIR
jgi:hypothetical protein